MGSPLKAPGTPNMPLFPLSPERQNRVAQHTSPGGGGPPPSPAMPDFGKPSHVRTSSDVQCMVARFNSLDIKDHAELRRKDEAALKRAQMGREEAEEQVKRHREEGRRLKRELDESSDRERKVMKRLDAVMEDFHRAKETHHHAQTLYEKEIRKARKEAFKSSSAVVKLQEELKATRNAFRVAQSDLDLEKRKSDRREQDTFTAQYELVAVQEQLQQVQAKMKTVEAERDALKTNLKEEEVTRVATEGRIALPPASTEDDEFASPKKSFSPRKNAFFANPESASRERIEMEQLRYEVQRERRLREHAQDRIEYMKMECQYQCCSCRVAENAGLPYVHDGSLEDAIDILKAAVPVEKPPAYSEMQVDEAARTSRSTVGELKEVNRPETPMSEYDPENHANTGNMFSSDTRDLLPHSQSQNGAMKEASQPEPGASSPGPEATLESEGHERASSPVDHLAPVPELQTPGRQADETLQGEGVSESHPFRTITTTTTVPLAGGFSTPTATSTNASKQTLNDASHTDPHGTRSHTPADFPPSISPTKGLTREEAILKLRQQRRDHRGREVAREDATGKENERPANAKGTPLKRAFSHHASENKNTTARHRRDISAPEMGFGTPGRTPRR